MSAAIDQFPSTTKSNTKNLLKPCMENPFFRISSSSNPCVEISKQRSHDLKEPEHNDYFDFQPIVGSSNQRKRKVNIITNKVCSSNNLNPIRINKDSVNSIDYNKLKPTSDCQKKNSVLSHDGKETMREPALTNKSKCGYKLNLLDSMYCPKIQINPPMTFTTHSIENSQQINKVNNQILSPQRSATKAIKSNSVDHHKKEKKKKPNGALDCLLTQQTKKTTKKKKRCLSKHKSLVKSRNISVSKAGEKEPSFKNDSQPDNVSTVKFMQTGNMEHLNSPNEKFSKSIQNLAISKSIVESVGESKQIIQSIETPTIKKKLKRGTFSFCSLLSCMSIGSKSK